MNSESGGYHDNVEQLALALAKLSAGSKDEALARLASLRRDIESSADAKSQRLLPTIDDQIARALRARPNKWATFENIESRIIRASMFGLVIISLAQLITSKINPLAWLQALLGWLR